MSEGEVSKDAQQLSAKLGRDGFLGRVIDGEDGSLQVVIEPGSPPEKAYYRDKQTGAKQGLPRDRQIPRAFNGRRVDILRDFRIKDPCPHQYQVQLSGMRFCGDCGLSLDDHPEAAPPIELPPIAETLHELKPDDLPQPPWVLHQAVPKPIGRSMFRGGPYVRVIDNALFLRELQADVARVPECARFMTGALQRDLAALERVLTPDEESAF